MDLNYHRLPKSCSSNGSQ